MSKVETIWDYLESKGYPNVPRPEKKVVQLVLESEKLNGAQTKRLAPQGMYSEKLDGLYSFITVIPTEDTCEVRHWNRTGKALPDCEELDQKIADSIQGNLVAPWVLISEVTSDDALAKLSGHLNPNRVNEHAFTPTNLQDNLHDATMLCEFIVGESKYEYHIRREWLESNIQGVNIIPVFHGSLEEARGYAESIWAVRGEGVVYADPRGGWIAGKRDETKIKLKEKLSFDVTVVGYCTGREDSKYEDVVGKLLVAFRAFGESKGEPLLIPISGMSDEQRKLWIEHPELIVGQVVKMDAKSYTETGNLREPRYKETRNDKSSDFPVVLKGNPEAYVKAKCMWVEHSWSVK